MPGRAELEAYGRRLCDGADAVFHFPIRHHSPACALHLARALAEIRPHAVVVEVPADFAPLLPFILDPATRAPVAVVSVAAPTDAPDRPAVLGYWPLSATAPELVALRLAAAQDARIVLADLPSGHRLRTSTGTMPEDGAAPPPLLLTGERPLAYSDYANGLVARLGARDFNEAWDRLFESRAAERDWRAFFADVGVHCALARMTAGPDEMAADGTDAREAHMRAALAGAVADAAGRPVAVVTGGFHTPALLDPAEVATPHGADGGTACKPYLVRFAHRNLDRMDGYGAGMPSPRWYERVLAAVEAGEAHPFDAAATEALLGLAVRLRREQPGFAPPLPGVVAALRQARGLAELRGLAGPGRAEVLDAVRSCLLKDEDPRFGSPVLEALHRELTGDAIGEVPRHAGSPPLVEAVRNRARALGFRVDDGQERRRELDIHRKERHRAASRFLHALRLLDAGFAQQVQGPDWTAGVQTGLLFEAWTYAWSPLVEGRLVALSAEGDTLDRAALGVLRGRAAALAAQGQARESDAAARLVLAAAQAGIAAAQAGLLPLLAEAVAEDPDFGRVVRCFGTLDGLWGGRQVLGLTGSPALGELRAACYRRAVDLLPTLADAQPDRAGDAAAALAGLHHLLDARRERRNPGTRERRAADEAATDALDRELFDEGVAALLGLPMPPQVLGAVGALAFLAGRLDGESFARQVCGALAGAAADPAERAAPLAGLILVQPALLRRCAPVLAGLDAALEGMEEQEFLAVLPHLRQALVTLDPHESSDVAARVAALKGMAGPLLLPASEVTEQEALANAARSHSLEELLAADGLGDWLDDQRPGQRHGQPDEAARGVAA